MANSSPAHYSIMQKALHWLIAMMVAIMVPVGVYMVNRGAATNFDATTNMLYTAHKSFGFFVLLLVIWRISLRIRRGAPAPVSTLTGFERFASETAHRLLYMLMVLVPLLGWAAISAYPARGVFFGLSLPPILPVNQALAANLFAAHKACAIVMVLVVGVHFAGAMMHLLVKKDGVMRRMLPGG